MYKKNTAGQHLTFGFVNATTGAALTGATGIAAHVSIDGAAQVTAGGTVAELANGQYNFAPSAADLNGNDCGFLFTATGAIPVNIHVHTTQADVTDAVHFGLSALPNVAANAAGGLLTSGTGTGQLNVSGGRADGNVMYWDGAAVVAPAVTGVPKVDVADIAGNTSAAVSLSNMMQSALYGQVSADVTPSTANNSTTFSYNNTTSPNLPTEAGFCSSPSSVLFFYAGTKDVGKAVQIISHTVSGTSPIVSTLTVSPALPDLPLTDGSSKFGITGLVKS